MKSEYKCKHMDCKYRRVIKVESNFTSCDYILMNKDNKSRGCSADECDKYVPRRKNEKIKNKLLY